MQISSAIARAEYATTMRQRGVGIENETGINPFAIYCSATGKKIAIIDDNSLCEIASDLSDGQLIELALLAARPSHTWIVKRRDCYTRLRENDPVGLLTNLIASIFDAMETGHKRRNFDGKAYATLWSTSAARVDFMRHKIKLRAALAALSPDTMKLALDRALELDARKGLETVFPPVGINLPQLINDFMVTFAALMQHCESELEAARINDSKAGSYFARQVTGLTPDPDRPKVTPVAARNKAAINEMTDLILSNSGIATLAELRELNDSIAQSNRTRREAAANIPTLAALAKSLGGVNVVSPRKAQEYIEKTNPSKLTTGGAIKL